jgi:hypothetical protein
MTHAKLDQSTIDIIRLAGYVDGEGCIQIGRLTKGQKFPQYRWLLSVGSGDLPNLELLKTHTKTSIVECKPRGGRVKVYQVSLSNAEAIVCLEKLEPYLLVKRPQAIEAIRSYHEYKVARVNKENELAREIGESAYLKLRLLKQHNYI